VLVTFKIYSWKIYVKFNTFHMSQTVHLNSRVNLIQAKYV